MYKNYIETELSVIKSNLATRGFSLVTLTPQFSEEAKQCADQMNEFFNLNEESKQSYFREPVFGWFEVPHKQVFRVATGVNMEDYQHPSVAFKNLISNLDIMMQQLVLELFPGVKEILSDLVPFDFGLVDVAKYNNQTVRKNNLNIVEHYDAGLLAFNFYDSEPGLEFKNNNEWIYTNKMAVLWTGNAVKSYSEQHPVGIHRVTTSTAPRLSMWYEVATKEQMRDDIKSGNYTGYDYEIALMEKEGFKAVKENDKIIGYENTDHIGWKALEANTTGSNKVAVGYNALYSGNNVAIGWKDIETYTTGSNKVAIGRNDGKGSNVAIGMSTMDLNKPVIKSTKKRYDKKYNI
jgi:hypothetical protein